MPSICHPTVSYTHPFYQFNIPVLVSGKKLLNYYNPKNQTLYLCKNIIKSSSITSLGIVAHEVEHVVQEKQGFKLMSLRNKMAGIFAMMSQLSPVVFVWGVYFRNTLLIYIGLFLLFGTIIFALLSLPLELNASQRALNTLRKIGPVSYTHLDVYKRQGNYRWRIFLSYLCLLF